MFRDISILYSCLISFINDGAYIQLVVRTSSSYSYSVPAGQVSSFKIEHPTSTFEVLPLFHSPRFLVVEKKTREVFVLCKNGMRIAFCRASFSEGLRSGDASCWSGTVESLRRAVHLLRSTLRDLQNFKNQHGQIIPRKPAR